MQVIAFVKLLIIMTVMAEEQEVIESTQTVEWPNIIYLPEKSVLINKIKTIKFQYTVFCIN